VGAPRAPGAAAARRGALHRAGGRPATLDRAEVRQLTPRIRPALVTDAGAVGDALAEAFADYVWITWALPELERRHLADLYRLEAGLAGAETGGTWLAEEDGDVLAVASWIPAGHPPLSAATRELIDREAAALLGDRQPVLEAADAANREHWPDGPSWLLAALGTRPHARGRGLAGALVAEGLRAVDALGHAAVLETSSEANVRFYERYGFTVTAEVDPPGGAPHVWVMSRPPSR